MYEKLIAPNSELEISNHWELSDKIYISIVCTTFNQEKYICDAIDSFLAQKSRFRFEILIHDDASNDDTPQILLSYQKKFPSIIRLVLQKENQYSQGKQISKVAVNYAAAEYIALCEGDDFWIDEHKIQKQYELLLKKPKFKLCFSACYTLNEENIVEKISKIEPNNNTVNAVNVIEGGGGYMSTATLFFHRNVVCDVPLWFDDAPVGDYYIQILGSIESGAVYLPDPTSVYRIQASGSWSLNRKNHRSKKEIIEEQAMHCYCIEELIKSHSKYKINLIKAMANLKAQASYDLMVNKYVLESRKMIEKSWSINSNSSRLQRMLFISRRIHMCIYFIVKIKKLIYKKSFF